MTKNRPTRTPNTAPTAPADLVIRRAVAADAGTLSELAARTFYESFAADNPAEDMAVQLARSYSPAIQLAEINDPTMQTLLVEIAGQAVAFTQMRDGPVPPCVTGPRPHEIWRFYVDRPWLGRGVAHQLMNRAIEEARALGKKTLWLGVWELNPRAIAFYRKSGFIQVGEHGFLFADQMQTDLVMVREV